ncbi:tetrahydromethanopterin S-methyltransferase subunit MtrC [Methanothermococcus okinawensis]|uniref:Tetrahydromethanopterin S-methyltransferase subunit C n=1 Tax=Methanothermococcus okinawensis (strain DSM 14208 / JCM 11175 / IH1) TaxID=647113 RepID=F8ALH4_METOI|nr:tetrahydromethanopterin S-methyltransferase subunit C [Methanothermococcus okinawensis]AEH06923.1 Tetrahydromethanopterin S-methyltransferase subunit C [Methanothermococcus okinawensis IH1]
MSHGGGGHAAELYPENQVLIAGVVLSIIGMYISQYVPQISMLIGGLLAVAATVAGANVTRKVAAYGLGTGVPSIGMVSLGMGTISAIAGVLLPKAFGIPNVTIPIVAAVVAVILGLIVGKLTVKPIGMKIPIMVQSMTKLSLMGTLSILGFCSAYAGGFSPDIIIPGAIKNGIIALAFIAPGMAILHPFNACLGPNESHKRTFINAIACGLLTWFIFSMAKLDAISIVVSLILFAIAYYKFVKQSLNDACCVLYTPELPKKEE